MPITVPSVLFVSAFDGKKLLIVMTVLAFTLTIESQIGYIADFIPEQLSSNEGIAGFIGIWIIFTVTQFYILAFVKFNNRGSTPRASFVSNVHNAVTVTQYLLAGIIAFVILQILLTQQFDTVMLSVVISISYGLWIVTLSLLAIALFSWYSLRKEKNLMVLILATSMIAYVVNGSIGLFFNIDVLMQQKPIIREGDVAVFTVPSISAELEDIMNIAYSVASTVAYVLTWLGAVMLLRPYVKSFGRIKFWVIMVTPMVYYLITFPLETLGILSYEDPELAMRNILIFTLAAALTGIIFGYAFLSVARTLRLGSPVRYHMIIAAYGFLLFYIAGSASVNQAAYPPFGLVSTAFTGLSCYLIYNGLYLSAVSVSQDMTLRKSIRKSVIEQSKLLHNIGTAEMEKQVQKQVLSVATKTSKAMAEETGIQASLNEDEMKDYMQLVINEINRKP
ncbi:MAG TPA: hypothetical protein VNA18_08250, partial [Nitrososphaeraceae archaeon]|nr:hypothetical protein [Nitrososphaeraceae archaeon]